MFLKSGEEAKEERNIYAEVIAQEKEWRLNTGPDQALTLSYLAALLIGDRGSLGTQIGAITDLRWTSLSQQSLWTTNGMQMIESYNIQTFIKFKIKAFFTLLDQIWTKTDAFALPYIGDLDWCRFLLTSLQFLLDAWDTISGLFVMP